MTPSRWFSPALGEAGYQARSAAEDKGLCLGLIEASSGAGGKARGESGAQAQAPTASEVCR